VSRLNGTIVRRSAGVVAVAGLVGAVVFLGQRGTNPDPAPVLTFLPGVDVSSHEPPIDWTRAAQLGLRFVIARATEGDSRKDAAYNSIRQEAGAAGLAFTAFHFARPDRAAGDAVHEAEFFQGVARIGPGDLAPVLDLEVSGGMGVQRLQAWVTAWLEEVTARVGMKPMIYTNLDFWRSHMGDTTIFAEAGYPLYVASWDRTTPVMPADNWGGHGWTLWQTAKCGRVRGITGCIRTDLYKGGDLGRLTVP
jgi:lysozyme